jgi:hypothetical protein
MVTSPSRLARAGALTLLAALSAVACNAVLGIGDATHDPSLDDGGTGSDGGDNCNTYCSLMATSCTGTNAEYLSDDDCQAMCAQFDPGIAGATTGDTLGCRISFAELAAADPVTNCQKAGPLGIGCTDRCRSFCELVSDLCDAKGVPSYASTSDCLTACAGYPYWLSTGDAGPPADAGCPIPGGDTSCEATNSLNCRVYHLDAAYSSSTAWMTHCPHTGLTSAVCY